MPGLFFFNSLAPLNEYGGLWQWALMPADIAAMCGYMVRAPQT